MKKLSVLCLILLTCGIFAHGQNSSDKKSTCGTKSCCSKVEQSSDIHCFASGTKITMADNSLKLIEKIVAGDKVMTYDFNSNKLVATEVTKLVEVRHSNLFEFIFGGLDLFIATGDHPLWTENKGWASLSPKKSNANYVQDTPVVLLEVGDKVFVPSRNTYATLRNVLNIEGELTTYTLELKSGNNFIAHGVVAKTEKAK